MKPFELKPFKFLGKSATLSATPSCFLLLFICLFLFNLSIPVSLADLDHVELKKGDNTPAWEHDLEKIYKGKSPIEKILDFPPNQLNDYVSDNGLPEIKDRAFKRQLLHHMLTDPGIKDATSYEIWRSALGLKPPLFSGGQNGAETIDLADLQESALFSRLINHPETAKDAGLMLPRLFSGQPAVKKLIENAQLTIEKRLASHTQIVTVDLLANPPLWNFNNFKITTKELEHLGKQSFEMRIDKFGNFFILPPTSTKYTSAIQLFGKISFNTEEGKSLILTSGSVSTKEGIGASIPTRDCSDCYLTINSDGKIQATGSHFPLFSPGKPIPSGFLASKEVTIETTENGEATKRDEAQTKKTTMPSSAILYPDHIELVGSSRFINSEGVRFDVTKNTAYFDDAKKYGGYKNTGQSAILSDIYSDQKKGITIKELTATSGEGNRIDISYDTTNGIPYLRTTIGRGKGAAAISEFKNGKPSAYFGIQGEAYDIKYGLPQTAIRVQGEAPASDRYLVKDRSGKTYLASCSPPKCRGAELVAWTFNALLDTNIRLRGITPQTRILELQSAGIPLVLHDAKERRVETLSTRMGDLSKKVWESEKQGKPDSAAGWRMVTYAKELAESQQKILTEMLNDPDLPHSQLKQARVTETLNQWWETLPLFAQSRTYKTEVKGEGLDGDAAEKMIDERSTDPRVDHRSMNRDEKNDKVWTVEDTYTLLSTTRAMRDLAMKTAEEKGIPGLRQDLIQSTVDSEESLRKKIGELEPIVQHNEMEKNPSIPPSRKSQEQLEELRQLSWRKDSLTNQLSGYYFASLGRGDSQTAQYILERGFPENERQFHAYMAQNIPGLIEWYQDPNHWGSLDTAPPTLLKQINEAFNKYVYEHPHSGLRR